MENRPPHRRRNHPHPRLATRRPSLSQESRLLNCAFVRSRVHHLGIIAAPVPKAEVETVMVWLAANGLDSLHADTRIWSRFGPSAVTLWPRCWRALELRHLFARPQGGTTMAKVLNEIDGGCESAHLMLSPNVRPCPLAVADRDRRAKLEPRDLTACFFGDPLPGMSALDRRRSIERPH
jgi:hypothetical protein